MGGEMGVWQTKRGGGDWGAIHTHTHTQENIGVGGWGREGGVRGGGGVGAGVAHDTQNMEKIGGWHKKTEKGCVAHAAKNTR